MTYVGLGEREQTVRIFEELRPFHARLQALQRQCRPFSRDYHALAVTLEALETTAYHFTRRPCFYGAAGDASGPTRPASAASAEDQRRADEEGEKQEGGAPAGDRPDGGADG
jgi:hypothetical protein